MTEMAREVSPFLPTGEWKMGNGKWKIEKERVKQSGNKKVHRLRRERRLIKNRLMGKSE
jgi:hypothetical protein